MRFRCIRVLAGATLACLFGRQFSYAAPPDRLRAIEDSRVVALSRDIHPLARPEYERGPVDPSQRISGVSFELQPAAGQQTALNAFLKAQRDPGSREYRHTLTPQQFGDRFGISKNDLAHLTSWLADQGLTIEHVGEARNWIMFGGTAGQIGRAFRTTLRYYEVNGEMHFANDVPPSIPAAFRDVVRSIRCLDDFRPYAERNGRAVDVLSNSAQASIRSPSRSLHQRQDRLVFSPDAETGRTSHLSLIGGFSKSVMPRETAVE